MANELINSRLILATIIITLLLSGCGTRTEPGRAASLSDGQTSAQNEEPPSTNSTSSKSSADSIKQQTAHQEGVPGNARAPIPPLGPHLAEPIGDGLLPDRIIVPEIALDTPVVELGWHAATNDANQIFSEWDVARYAAGWHKNSARLGQEGNVVLSGHNNILGAVFRDLDRLKKGDEAILWAGGRQFKYVVERVMIVPEKYASPEQRTQNAEWIQPTDDPRLTLVSCWPRDDNSHRIIVVAHPVEAVSTNQ